MNPYKFDIFLDIERGFVLCNHSTEEIGKCYVMRFKGNREESVASSFGNTYVYLTYPVFHACHCLQQWLILRQNNKNTKHLLADPLTFIKTFITLV